MPAPITSSVFQSNFFSDLFRQRWGSNIVNEGDVRDIDGFRVDVSGQASRGETTTRSAFTAGSGARYATEPAHTPPVDPALPSSSLLTLQGEFPDQAYHLDTLMRPEGVDQNNPCVVMIPAHVDVVHSEEAAPDQVSSVGYYSGEGAFSRTAETDFTRGQIERLQALARIERDLGAEYGEPVKLAWDGVAREYLMLRPGQPGYDRIASVNDLVGRLPRDLQLMGYSEGMVRDLTA